MDFNESVLKFWYDRMVDFKSLKANDFDVEELFINQGWKRYFEMLNGPIYTKMVKEFWMKSTVYDDLSVTMEVDQIVLNDPSLKGKTRQEMGLKEYNGTEI
ncbi:cullin-like protein, partial [Trifolium medium]|nr:cullin-like protein [Trifolium medium]